MIRRRFSRRTDKAKEGASAAKREVATPTCHNTGDALSGTLAQGRVARERTHASSNASTEIVRKLMSAQAVYEGSSQFGFELITR